jgi:hypothetical protein
MIIFSWLLALPNYRMVKVFRFGSLIIILKIKNKAK